MTFKTTAIALLAALLTGPHATAQAAEDGVPPPPGDDVQVNPVKPPAKNVPPPLPDESADDSRIQPQREVEIVPGKGTRIERYRVGGELRYVKITPSAGPSYYLIDTDGDGVLDKRHTNLENPPVQQWLLLEW